MAAEHRGADQRPAQDPPGEGLSNADGSGVPTLPRRLSALGLWLLMINGMIGAGIFGMPGDLARLTGPLSPAVFLLCAVLIALMAWVNVVGVGRAIGSLAALTLLKLFPMLIVAIAGLVGFGLPSLPADALLRNASGLGPAIVLAIYAFVGFESGLIPGGEARDPQRDMPRALLWSLAVCAVLYALVQWSSPRITFGLAGQRLLPRWFATVHARYQTPSVSIMVFAARCRPCWP